MLSITFILFTYAYRGNVSFLESRATDQASKKTPSSTNGQQSLPTSAAVECRTTAECRIINLDLLSKHIEDVTQHVATCQACLKISQSNNAITIVGEKIAMDLLQLWAVNLMAAGKSSHLPHLLRFLA